MQSIATIKCCLCGLDIPSTGIAMCTACLAKETDLSSKLNKSETIVQCRECQRWKGNTKAWLQIEPETSDMLSFCLKRIKNLGTPAGGVRLVDSKFVWTEEHSRRIRVQLTLGPWEEKVAIRQICQIEFVVHTEMCPTCQSDTVDQTWRAVVQLRQMVKPHRRTLFFLEQEILRLNLAQAAMNLDQAPMGLDVYFSNQPAALKFANTVATLVPVFVRTESKQLTGQDLQNSIFRHRHTIYMEVVPICKYDLCVLPKVLNTALFGSGNGVVLVERISRMIHVVNVETGVQREISAQKFASHPFKRLNLVLQEFIVLDVDIEAGGTVFVEVAREKDFGHNDDMMKLRIVPSFAERFQHVECGQTVLGYDVSHWTGMEEEVLHNSQTLPQAVLVKVHKA